jgi:hypothetical protein
MGINATELNLLVIRPALNALGENSQVAESYLLKLAEKRSHYGEHLADVCQSGLGLYQITPESHTALWDTYLAFDPDLASKVRGLASQREFLVHPHAELATNLVYASAIAWLMSKQPSANT